MKHTRHGSARGRHVWLAPFCTSTSPWWSTTSDPSSCARPISPDRITTTSTVLVQCMPMLSG